MPNRKAQPKQPHQSARRKTKPRFDVPADVGGQSAASWVYRDDATAEAVTPSPAVNGTSEPAAESRGPLQSMAMGLLAASIELMELITSVTVTLAATPLGVLRRRLMPD